MDLFIGEGGPPHRGLGPSILTRFLEELVFASEGIGVCIIDPEPGNGAAIRAYEKVGFRHFRSVETEGGPAHLTKLGREVFRSGVRV